MFATVTFTSPKPSTATLTSTLPAPLLNVIASLIPATVMFIAFSSKVISSILFTRLSISCNLASKLVAQVIIGLICSLSVKFVPLAEPVVSVLSATNPSLVIIAVTSEINCSMLLISQLIFASPKTTYTVLFSNQIVVLNPSNVVLTCAFMPLLKSNLTSALKVILSTETLTFALTCLFV